MDVGVDAGVDRRLPDPVYRMDVLERHTDRPLVDLRTIGRRQLVLTNIASLIFAFSMLSMSLSLPQILQLPAETGYGLGQSMLVVGLVMAPSGLVMMAVAPLSAWISAA